MKPRTSDETRMENIGPPTPHIEWSPIPDPEFKSNFDEKAEWRDFCIILGISIFSIIIMIFSIMGAK